MNQYQNDFKPICVGDLINDNDKYSFVIPSFQRGYRWDKKQVEDLLNDLHTFVNGTVNQGDTYYLQPLIVCKNNDSNNGSNNSWYVLDGQQRLTTLRVVIQNLKQFASTFEMTNIENGLYDIEYQSRAAISFSSPNKDIDINNYYVSLADEIVKEWINELLSNSNGSHYLSNILGALTSKTPSNSQLSTSGLKFVKLIWFDINDASNMNIVDEIEIYNRFNSNKIKLTPSELIKALYVLKNKNLSNDNISNLLNDWNNIEKQFQSNEFWHLFSSSDIQTRIDFLFNVLVNNFSEAEVDKDKAYRYFQKKYDEQDDLCSDWDKVKIYFNILVKCYENNVLNNYFGLLIYLQEEPKNIIDIVSNSNYEYDKVCDELRKKIKTKIWGRRTIDFNDVAQLTYDDNYELVKNVLLLYNIETCNIQNKKFDFNNFYGEKWELEHVDSQNKTFTSNSSIKEWLEYVKIALLIFTRSIQNQNMLNQCDSFITSLDNNSFNKIAFDTFKSQIDDYFAEKDANGNVVRLGDDEKQRIWNLALLDKPTNIGFSNSPFPAKRQYLIKNRMEKGLFVPICTERLFLKYYVFTSNNNRPINLDLFHWTRDDRIYYLNDIKSKLEKYFN